MNDLRDLLRRKYRMTPRQIDLAIEFLSSADTQQASTALGIKHSTGRQYMKAIRRKTKTHNLASLMKVLMIENELIKSIRR